MYAPRCCTSIWLQLATILGLRSAGSNSNIVLQYSGCRVLQKGYEISMIVYINTMVTAMCLRLPQQTNNNYTQAHTNYTD